MKFFLPPKKNLIRNSTHCSLVPSSLLKSSFPLGLGPVIINSSLMFFFSPTDENAELKSQISMIKERADNLEKV